MSRPVVTEVWAGNLDCTGSCRRKRLMASEFSKKSLDLYRKQNKALRCKQCIQEAEAQERIASLQKSSVTEKAPTDGPELTRECANCQQEHPQSLYNKNQWNNKKEGVSRCIHCIEAAAKEEAQQSNAALLAKIEAAQVAVQEAQGTARQLPAESVLAALQAELVTGLKPVRMNQKPRGASLNKKR